MLLAPYQARVIEEHEQLRTKRRALQTFLDSAASADLIDGEERRLMAHQVALMTQYEHALQLRINRFK